MAKDIFDNEVEKASEEIESRSDKTDTSEFPAELQEELSNIESLVAMNPSVVDSQEYKDLMARIDAHDGGQASEEEDEDEDEEEEEEESEEESEEEESDDDDDDDEEDEEEEEIDDAFGLLSKGKKAKKVKIDFDVPKEMEAMLASKYGIKDANTFFGSVDTWRTQAQEGVDVKKQLDAITSDIGNLPPDLRESISKWADGEDYKTPFTDGERLDFGSDFNDQDIESLVQHYLPEEYDRLVKSLNKKDIEDEEFEDKIELLARSTKRLFTDEKKALIDKRVQYTKQQENLQKELKTSALSSVDNLSKAYPNFSPSKLNKVRSVLVEGKIDSLFYDSKGAYTAEAAELVANAIFGKEMKESMIKLAKRKGMSEANQKIVDSSPKTVRKQKNNNSKEGVSTKAVQHLSGILNDKDPYS